jgi:hypothetical protein
MSQFKCPIWIESECALNSDGTNKGNVDKVDNKQDADEEGRHAIRRDTANQQYMTR